MPYNPRQFEEPLFISRDELQNKTTTPAVDLNVPGVFESIRQIPEYLKKRELSFLPETSPLRYLPGELAGETFKAGVPQTPIEAGLMTIPFGTLAKPLAKTPLGKIAGAKIEKEVPRIFQKIENYINEFSEIPKGIFIKNPDEKLFITENATLSRRVLKHIVEQRKEKDKLTNGQIKYLIDKSPEVIRKPEIDIPNPTTKYPNSILRGKFDNKTNQGIMVILDKETGEIREIINIFGREIKKFFQLLEKTKTPQSSISEGTASLQK